MLAAIRFKKINQIHELIEQLQQLSLIKIDKERIVTPADELAKNFFVAMNGETYLKQDIQKLSEEEAAKLNISFLLKSGDTASLLELKKEIDDEEKIQQYIHNKPLVESLTQINLNKKKELNLPLISANSLSPFVMILPVITREELSYEEHELEMWFAWLKQQKQAFLHPAPLQNKPLTKNEMIPNIALRDLIHVSFMQGEMKKAQYKAHLNTQNPVLKMRLEKQIQKLEIRQSEYELSLKSRNDYHQTCLAHYKNKIQHIENIYAQHPDWREKTLEEMQIVQDNAIQANHRWLARGRGLPGLRTMQIVMTAGFLLGLAATLLSIIFLPPVAIALGSLGVIGSIVAGVGLVVGAGLFCGGIGLAVTLGVNIAATIFISKKIQKCRSEILETQQVIAFKQNNKFNKMTEKMKQTEAKINQVDKEMRAIKKWQLKAIFSRKNIHQALAQNPSEKHEIKHLAPESEMDVAEKEKTEFLIKNKKSYWSLFEKNSKDHIELQETKKPSRIQSFS